MFKYLVVLVLVLVRVRNFGYRLGYEADERTCDFTVSHPALHYYENNVYLGVVPYASLLRVHSTVRRNPSWMLTCGIQGLNRSCHRLPRTIWTHRTHTPDPAGQDSGYRV